MARSTLLLQRRVSYASIRSVPATAVMHTIGTRPFASHAMVHWHAQECEGSCVAGETRRNKRVNLTPATVAASELVVVSARGLQRLQHGVVHEAGVEVELAGGGVVIARPPAPVHELALCVTSDE